MDIFMKPVLDIVHVFHGVLWIQIQRSSWFVV